MVRDLKSNEDELFNLTTDPLAQNNIAEEHNTLVDRLLATYQELNEKKPPSSSTRAQLNGQTQAQLAALGYIDSSDTGSIQENTDSDNDGIPDNQDNCHEIPNPNQEDADMDSAGDVCDNCLEIVNPNQEDLDEDLIGDACDQCVDTDWDGYGNPGFPKNDCAQDNCPTIFNPAQGDADKDGIGDDCEFSSYEYHWLEAEHARSIVTPALAASDKTASGERYIVAPNGTGSYHEPGSILATYAVNIAQAGGYVLWGRVIAANAQDDSFFVQLDDDMQNTWDVATGNFWQWDLVNNRNRSDPVKFNLTEGEHLIKISLREDGTKLDKLLLTNNLDFVPGSKRDAEEN
jgi:hypothetical protein